FCTLSGELLYVLLDFLQQAHHGQITGVGDRGRTGTVSLPQDFNPNTLEKCLALPRYRFHGHQLNLITLRKLPEEIRNPAIVIRGSHENSFVLVTQLKDHKDRPIIVPVALDRRNKKHMAHQVTSAYGREYFSEYLQEQYLLGNIIAYNEQKADNIFQSRGLSLPKEEIYICFDNSISYTNQNVKGLDKFSERLKIENTWSEYIAQAEKVKERLCCISVNALKQNPVYTEYLKALQDLPSDENYIVSTLIYRKHKETSISLKNVSKSIAELEKDSSEMNQSILNNKYIEQMALMNRNEADCFELELLSKNRTRTANKEISVGRKSDRRACHA
ncbi:MAG: hypothetical protein ACI4I6_06850, partial [Hominimerdicola sp.]